MSLADMIKPETRKAHRASWFVYVGEGEARRRIPREATMRGLWGYDVVCSCDWDSKTGGGTRRAIEDALWEHRWDEQCKQEAAAEGRVRLECVNDETFRLTVEALKK